MIPIKYKKRLFEANKDLWRDLLDEAAPSTDIGRAQSTSSMIPNLGHHKLEEKLKSKYKRKHIVFTDCASDALDLVVHALPFKTWYAPAYTWYSPLNALAKANCKIEFLDVEYESRTVDYSGYDPTYPILVPHIDGRAAPRPPQSARFILEDAAQSPFASGNNFGDVIILSLGSSKKLGLLGQGGCLLTDDEQLALRVKSLACFGLSPLNELIEPGFKSYLDPYNALCSYHIMERYEDQTHQNRIDQITAAYNDALGIQNPSGLERYTFKVTDRDHVRSTLHEAGIETRVWIKKHGGQLPAYGKTPGPLPISDKLVEECLDIPLYELLTDHEVEHIEKCLRTLSEYVTN